jgi:transposase
MLIAEMRESGRARRRIEASNVEFVERARTTAPARRLATIPGIGALNATALWRRSARRRLRRGRDLAPGSAWCRAR